MSDSKIYFSRHMLESESKNMDSSRLDYITELSDIFRQFLPRCMECRRGLSDEISVRLSVCLSVCPSVRLSVKRVHCDKTEERYV